MKVKYNFIEILRYILLSCVIALGLMTIVATGGGGGGGGGGTSTQGISYTGLTTQAVVTDANAQDLTAGAYDGGSTGAILGSVGAIQIVRNGITERPRTLRISQALEAAMLQVDLVSRYYGIYVGAIYTESDTVYGYCGGTGSYTISIDDSTGIFSGTIQFNSYCEQGTIISGNANLSGTVNLYTKTLLTFSFSFDNITATYGAESITIDGNVSVNVAGSPKTIAMNFLIKDNVTNKVYKIENYSMSITDAVGYIAIEMSGRFYDPDYGYVILSTETPFRINDGDIYPVSGGVLVAAGDNNTRAKLTSLPSATCKVEADTDGDGTYDWNSGSLNWSDL